MDLTDNDLHPFTLQRILTTADPGWVELGDKDLRTLVDTVGPISQGNVSKLRAVQTAIRQPSSVLDDWMMFSHCLIALNGLIPNFMSIEVPSYPELIGGGGLLLRLLGAPPTTAILKFAAATAMFRMVPELVVPFAEGDKFMSRRGDRTDVVADALAYTMVLEKRLREQATYGETV